MHRVLSRVAGIMPGSQHSGVTLSALHVLYHHRALPFSPLHTPCSHAASRAGGQPVSFIGYYRCGCLRRRGFTWSSGDAGICHAPVLNERPRPRRCEPGTVMLRLPIQARRPLWFLLKSPEQAIVEPFRRRGGACAPMCMTGCWQPSEYSKIRDKNHSAALHKYAFEVDLVLSLLPRTPALCCPPLPACFLVVAMAVTFWLRLERYWWHDWWGKSGAPGGGI